MAIAGRTPMMNARVRAAIEGRGVGIERVALRSAFLRRDLRIRQSSRVYDRERSESVVRMMVLLFGPTQKFEEFLAESPVSRTVGCVLFFFLFLFWCVV